MQIYMVLTSVMLSRSDMKKIMQNLNTKKVTDFDKLPANVIALAVPVNATPLANIVNNSIEQCKFPTAFKTAEIVPIHKKKDQLLRENHRPVSIPTNLSKVIEISINNTLTYTNIILDDRISAYRKGYSCQYALLNFVEEWRKDMDNQEVPAALLLDLCKAFDAMPHDILVAKLYAYGMSQETVTLLASYLRNRKQRVKVGNCESDWEPLSKGVPQGSIMGPILFNLFLNDVVLFIKNSSLTNHVDDNTLITIMTIIT